MSIQFSATNPEQILNNPLNNSVSKYQYSFQKSPRFLSSKKTPEVFYDLPSQRSTRKAGFGIGDRPDFTKQLGNSPPAKYELPSCFNKELSTSRGKSFGTCREKMTEFGTVRKGLCANPGPGSYPKANINLNESLSFSLRPKTRDVNNPLFLDGMSSVQCNPGPGHYENYESINKTGKFLLSKYRSSAATAMNPPESKRFKSAKRYAPGPGQYKPRNDIDKSGQYVLSIYRSYGARNFANSSLRKAFVDEQNKQQRYTPGPGQYRLPSDFGNYDHIDMFRGTSARSSRSNSNYKNNNGTLSQVDLNASASSSRR